MKLTNAQRTALEKILAAGDAGLDYYWYPMPRNRRVLINGNCVIALDREHKLITTSYRREVVAGAERTIRTAHLTSTGLAVLAEAGNDDASRKLYGVTGRELLASLTDGIVK